MSNTQYSINIHFKISYGYGSPVININATLICVTRRNTKWTTTYHVHYKLVIKITHSILLPISWLSHKVFFLYLSSISLFLSSLFHSFSAYVLGPSMEHWFTDYCPKYTHSWSNHWQEQESLPSHGHLQTRMGKTSAETLVETMDPEIIWVLLGREVE